MTKCIRAKAIPASVLILCSFPRSTREATAMTVDSVARAAATPPILQIGGPTKKSSSSERQFAKAAATAGAATVQDRTRIDIPEPRSAYQIQQEYLVRYGKPMEKDLADYLADHDGSCGKTLIQIFDAAAPYGFD